MTVLHATIMGNIDKNRRKHIAIQTKLKLTYYWGTLSWRIQLKAPGLVQYFEESADRAMLSW